MRNKSRNCNFGYSIVNVGNTPHLSNTLTKSVGGLEQNIIADKKDYSGWVISPKRSPINNDGLRFLSPIECARLQGFADYAFKEGDLDLFSFNCTIPATIQYTLLGNSVSIPVIESIAEFIFKLMEQYKL